MKKIILCLCFCYVTSIDNPRKISTFTSNQKNKCQKTCHPLHQQKINIHIIPHSHNDLGWLKTFDEYYFGTGRFYSTEDVGVQYIISSVVSALKANLNRRFVQVETGFFWKWWQNQTRETRKDVIQLVREGRLEMVNGGWSMNDEATTHYQSIIDQFTWGFRKLNDTVGACGRPKIGWQIDTFGHSREHASLMKQLGFDGLVIVRIDYRDKNRRRVNKTMEFMWTTNPNFDNSKLFTTMFPDHYAESLCFDVLCVDYVNSATVDSQVKYFAKILTTYKNYYLTNNLMIPMGGDFLYQQADRNFDSLDQLIEGFKNDKTYNVIYSTPSCYIKAVQSEVAKRGIILEEKLDDFFPYASEAHNFWTGYFTSRPSLKRFERVGNNILQSSKQLVAMARMFNQSYEKYLEDLRGVMGVLQHHDSITGTAKQHVADDYARMLYEAIAKVEKPLSAIISHLLKKNKISDFELELSTCLLSNISICKNSLEDRFLVIIHNPLSREVTHYVRLPVNGESYNIRGPDGVEIYDVFDDIHSFENIHIPIPTPDQNIATKELVFAAKNLPALGFKVYYVEKNSWNFSSAYKKFMAISEETLLSFGTEFNGFTINNTTGKLETVTIKGVTQKITQEFLYYSSSGGTNRKASGAYIFRPDSEATPITTKKFQNLLYVRGNLVDECIQIINDEVSQIIKVYKDEESSFIEFDWLVGNLQYVDSKSKEVITRFTISNFSNSNTFYTDANGRQLMRRKLNSRSDFVYNATADPISSNYYPVTSRILIKDEAQKLEMAILNDRAQGGSSLSDGSIELMIHRRLKEDDGYGVEEVLNEVQYNKGLYVRGQHFLTFGSTERVEENETTLTAFERILAHKILLAPRIFISNNNFSFEDFEKNINFKLVVLNQSLPDNVNILTLEPWKKNYLLRIEHIFEEKDNDPLSQKASVNFSNLFLLFNITEIMESTLGANKIIKNNTKKNFEVTLHPMEIKTFLIKTNKNNEDHDYYDDFEEYSQPIYYQSSAELIYPTLGCFFCCFIIFMFI